MNNLDKFAQEQGFMPVSTEEWPVTATWNEYFYNLSRVLICLGEKMLEKVDD